MYSFRGDRLKELRINRGLRQDDIASKLNINRVSYSHYESGKNTPPSDKLSRIADILNTSSDYLLGKTDDPTSFANTREFDWENGVIRELTYEEMKFDEETRDIYAEIKQTKEILSQLNSDDKNKEIKRHLNQRLEELESRIKEKAKEYGLVQENKKYPSFATKKDIVDLQKFLELPEINFDGFPVNDEQRARIKGYMENMFWDAKQKNKRKK